MADEILRSKHAFGSSENIGSAISRGDIDSYDILFLDGDTDKPKIGWIDKNGKPVIVTDEKADLTEIEADVDKLESSLSVLETEVTSKANSEEVDAKFDEIETALGDVVNASHTHEKVKYEISGVPVGTLVKYFDNEIRVMCPSNAVFTKQAVGTGGDANSYYMTFKTYVPNDSVVGYIEHLGDQVDSEILNTFSTDKYGRRYQPTWLALAKYDETTGVWSYYGANSSKEKFIGWDYQIDWYNADGVMIASDSIRINLSNENCHASAEPYYVGSMMKEIDTKIEERLAEIESSIEVIEF